MQRAQRLGFVGFAIGVGVVALASAAFACVSGPAMNLNPGQARPGSEVTVTGTGWRKADPVLIRFNALNGPVLATMTPASEGFSGTVTIPADVKPANYVLIATQTAADGSLTQMPVRALLTVVGDGGVPTLTAPVAATDTARPAALAKSESVSTASLVLVGLGVAGIAMFVAGMAALLAGRRREQPEPAAVRQ